MQAQTYSNIHRQTCSNTHKMPTKEEEKEYEHKQRLINREQTQTCSDIDKKPVKEEEKDKRYRADRIYSELGKEEEKNRQMGKE